MEKDEKDLKETVDILEEEPTEEKKKKSRKETELEVLKDDNKKLLQEKNEMNTKYLVALAEQQNYKKRIDDELVRFYKYSTYDMAKNIISVLDNFDLAMVKDSLDPAMSAYLQGFKMIRNSLFSVLEKEGVKEIEALDKEFDPTTMNALGVEHIKDKADQVVTKQLLKGYMYKDRLLRAAQVMINSLEEETPEVENKEENK